MDVCITFPRTLAQCAEAVDIQASSVNLQADNFLHETGSRLLSAAASGNIVSFELRYRASDIQLFGSPTDSADSR